MQFDHSQHRHWYSGLLRSMGRVGMVISVLCAIHCMLTPVFLVALPWLGMVAHVDPFWEMVLVGSALVVTFVSLLSGYRSHRRRPALGLWVLAAGVYSVTFAIGHSEDAFGITLMVSGSIALSGAQLLNLRYWRERQCCPHDHAPAVSVTSPEGAVERRAIPVQ